MKSFVAVLGLQSALVSSKKTQRSGTCQYNKPGYGVLTYHEFQTDNDCRNTGKLLECIGGTMVAKGPALGCPAGCTWKGEDVKDGFFVNDCDSGFVKTCNDGAWRILGPVSVPEDCPYKDCSYQGGIVSHGYVHNDCDGSGIKSECRNGKIIQISEATNCGLTDPCIYSKGSWKGEVPHGYVDNDCVNGKLLQCVDGDMKYLGAPKGCDNYKECSYKSKTVPHGFTDNDCNSGKAVECVNGNMENKGAAKGCQKECLYTKNTGDKTVPHGFIDNDCVNGKAVECVNGSMEYLGPAKDCQKDCQYSKNNNVVTVSHGYDDNDCVFTGKIHECDNGVMVIKGDAVGCEELNEPEGDIFVPPADPPLTQVTNMVDDFTSLAETNLGVGSTLYNSVVIPVNKITKRMKSVNRRFNCENGTQVKKSRRVQRSANPCETIISLIDDIIAWNKENVFSCYKDGDKPARLGKSYDKKLNMAKTKLQKRCEKRRFKD